jgi:hypothetical protein
VVSRYQDGTQDARQSASNNRAELPGDGDSEVAMAKLGIRPIAGERLVKNNFEKISADASP